MRCLLCLLALGGCSVNWPDRATPDLSVSHQMNNGGSEKGDTSFLALTLVPHSCCFPKSIREDSFRQCMDIGFFSLTLVLPLKNTAFSGSEMPEGRNTDRTCHHDNGFCELPDTQTLLWEGVVRERQNEREERREGVESDNPIFPPWDFAVCSRSHVELA